MSEQKLPRYSIIGPPFIHEYGIVDEWDRGVGTTVLKPFYATRAKAEKDCKLLNKAQAIRMGDRKP